MKKILLLIVLSNFLFTQEIKGLKELVNYLFPLIMHKKYIKVYTLPKYYIYFPNSKFIIVRDCKKSDIVFGNIECKNRPVFALNYDFYISHKNVIGAFYYRKGRPQLKFKKHVYLKYFKSIPNELKDFVE